MSPVRRYVVSGVVQGVGYRWFVTRAARSHGVDGWVRNREDGRVEVFAAGDENALAALKADLERGPRMSRVSGVTEEDAGEATVEPGFRTTR